jgi:hypothetical protein
LWPKWCKSFEEVPADLVQAIEHAYKVVNWHENMLEEEIPPKWMWGLDWELETWFIEVKRVRENRYSSGGGSDTTEGDGEILENEYSARFRDD